MRNALILGIAFLVLAALQVGLERGNSKSNADDGPERLETRYKIERGTIFYLAEHGEWVKYDRLPQIETYASVNRIGRD